MRTGKLPTIPTLASLLLLIILSIPIACISPSTPQSNLPPAAAPPILPSKQVVHLKTAIIDGPEGKINYDNVTFTWGTVLSSVNPTKLTYSTFLKGYEQDYTPFLPETSRTFSNLPSKDYVFYVKAQDADGNIEPEPASRAFTVAAAPPGMINPQPVPGGGGGYLLIGVPIDRLVVGSDGLTLYAMNSFYARLYRSEDGGEGWYDISSKVGGGAPWVDLAAAPDDPTFVAIATNGGREVYMSSDKGVTFTATGLSSVIGGGEAATSLAVSPAYGAPRRDIAVGTWTGAAAGRVFMDVLSGFSSGWMDTGAAGADIFALKYSPSFDSDGTLLAVASSFSHTYLYMGTRDLGSTSVAWNTSPGYPAEIGVAGTGTPGTPLNYADIAFPADYNGTNSFSRDVFVSWSKTHPGQDVYRMIDTQAYRMNMPEAIASIAFYGRLGSGKMFAGAAKCVSGGGCYQVQTYFSGNPGSNSPAWQPSQKPPTGSSNAQVAWSPDGTLSYAATSGSGAAVSHSRNDGYTWNQ
ncbi:MAG: hypothetical protein WB588_02870 [Dehalococcoidia bacterium]